MVKILILRFSSFGDVTQCLSVPSALKQRFADAEIHWVTREDFAPLLQGHPHLRRVWALQRQGGGRALRDLARALRREKFDLIYDAHNNLRSRLICFHLRWWPFPPWPRPQLIRRSIRRWKRFFLFRFRWNLFEQPFSGQRDLLEPLQKLGVSKQAPPPPQLFLSDTAKRRARERLQIFGPFVALAASAAHPLKRWPANNWVELVRQHPEEKFVLLGGAEDHFLEEIRAAAPERVINLAGQTDLLTSAAVVDASLALVSNDTGLLHVAEQLGKPAIALMGPAPFGFPSRPLTRILELDLDCRPCSKHGQGPCVNPEYQKCLRGILPTQVSQELTKILKQVPPEVLG